MAIPRRLIFAAALAAAVTTAVATAGAAPTRTQANVLVVNTTGDAGNDANLDNGVCADSQGRCNLDTALQQARHDGGDTIRFNLAGSPPPPFRGDYDVPSGTTIDGTTQPGYGDHPVVSIEGLILHGNSTVKGISISGATLGGISVTGGHNVIVGNWIGVAPDGTVKLTSGSDGVAITGASDADRIGGTTASERNVIAGFVNGIVVSRENGATPRQTTIEGNFIGVKADGETAAPNRDNGIALDHAEGATIGGFKDDARNVISGNGTHVQVEPGADYGIYVADSTGVEIQGNFIGTDDRGRAAVPNKHGGIDVERGTDIHIGSVTTPGRAKCSAPCNVVSGNNDPAAYGITIDAVNASNNPAQIEILGNFIGTDVTGRSALPNGGGILVNGSDGVTIGGTKGNAPRNHTCESGCNVISGNEGDGVDFGLGTGTEVLNVVQGNFIGTDLSGTEPVPNRRHGIEVRGLGGVTIGGSGTSHLRDYCERECNVISANLGCGIQILNRTTGSLQIFGNVLGLGSRGEKEQRLGNGEGVCISKDKGLAVGGAKIGDGNIISGNRVEAIGVAGSQGTGIFGNWIGVDAKGEPAPNEIGVLVEERSTSTRIGSSERTDLRSECTGACNVVSSNADGGVKILQSSNNHVEANYIGVDPSGRKRSPNKKFGVLVSTINAGTYDTALGNVIGGRNWKEQGNVISGNTGDGVRIDDIPKNAGLVPNAATTILGNLIGTTNDGTEALGNGVGVELRFAGGVTVGGRCEAANVIAGNRSTGVLIRGSKNRVQFNLVGLTHKGKELPNGGAEIGLAFGQGNVVTRNDVAGGKVAVAAVAGQENTVADNAEKNECG